MTQHGQSFQSFAYRAQTAEGREISGTIDAFDVNDARQKLESKNCDMVVANLVNQEATGFEADENEVVLVLRTGETIPLSRAPKRVIADRIFDQVLKLRLALHAAQ